MCVDTIRAQPEIYTDAFLGRPVAEYLQWLALPTSWGGSIETAVLAELLGVEIAVLFVKSNSVLVFGEEGGEKKRIYLGFWYYLIF